MSDEEKSLEDLINRATAAADTYKIPAPLAILENGTTSFIVTQEWLVERGVDIEALLAFWKEMTIKNQKTEH
jgi:hypothetical protein